MLNLLTKVKENFQKFSDHNPKYQYPFDFDF